MMLVDLIWKFIGSGFLKYSLVGMVGVVIHFGLLWLLTEQAHFWYMGSAAIAIAVASTNNYFLNYLWTFKSRKDRISNHLIGWLKFLGSIGITEVFYLGLLYLFTEKGELYYLVSAFLALSCTTVIRYITANKWIWGKKNGKVYS